MALNPETFTDKTTKILAEARDLCLEESHVQITPTHVANVLFSDQEVRPSPIPSFLFKYIFDLPFCIQLRLLFSFSLVSPPAAAYVDSFVQGLAKNICSKAGVDPINVERSLKRILVKVPKQDPAPADVGLSAGLTKLLRAAQTKQRDQGDSHLAVDHILVVLHEDRDVAAALNEVGLTKSKLEAAVKDVRGSRKVDSKSAEETYEALSKYGHDLVADAESGKLDPVIGRADEISRVIRVLSRRTKNNPVLIGEVRAYCFRFLWLLDSDSRRCSRVSERPLLLRASRSVSFVAMSPITSIAV